MPATSPMRVDDDLYASAKDAGAVQSRSASQQITHWARIGRELEQSPSVSHRRIQEVLDGAARYDDLTVDEQAVVRSEWAERMDERRRGLDMADVLGVDGDGWVELDDDGDVVTGG
jgi:hypothetical protein